MFRARLVGSAVRRTGWEAETLDNSFDIKILTINNV